MNASAGVVMKRKMPSERIGWVSSQLNGKVNAMNRMSALTSIAGTICFACFTPKTNVFLKVCCAGMRAKLTSAKYAMSAKPEYARSVAPGELTNGKMVVVLPVAIL